MQYVSLYNKSMYSIAKSSVNIEELVLKAKDNGQLSLAITDENVTYGHFKFYKECKRQKIKPILGLTLNVESELGLDSKLVLLARNDHGYKNILKLSSSYNLLRKPVTFELLKKYCEDIIAIIPIDSNDFNKYIENNKIDDAKNYYNKIISIFIDTYIGVSNDYSNVFKLDFINSEKIVALPEVLYLNKENREALLYLDAIGNNNILNKNKYRDNKFYNCDEVKDKFKNNMNIIDNTVKIAKDCNVTLNLDDYKLPKYPLEATISSKEYLYELCRKGLEKRIKQDKTKNISKYVDRLKYELKIITRMNYEDYFLIVWDVIKYAKHAGILVGPGRGSAAGSLVSYVLGITNIDPIKYNLLFERFLNPERISMPDIDIDFPDDKRDEIINYLVNKYGKLHVSQIVTFGSFASRSAIRDIARVMKLDNNFVNEIIKHIPANLKLSEAINNSKELQKDIDNVPEVKKLLTLALSIEGMVRHTSTHAAGIIITDKEITDYVALQLGVNGVYQTQLEASDLEKIGLLKIDLLGLKNLAIIKDITNKISEDLNIDIDVNKIPLNDEETLKIIANGDTSGIFQLESDGMKNLLRKLKVNHFEDIVVANALYRPGPMDNISEFIRRRNNPSIIKYNHKDLIPYLQSTNGIIVYQEQIMQIANKIAGYTYAQADLLRRAIAKKSMIILENERKQFISGTINNGYSQQTAEDLFEYILKFASYGFNRSHSVAYSVISFQLAYLKTHYYKYFMVTVLSSVISSEKQLQSYIKEIKRNRIKVAKPSINFSQPSFSIYNGDIIFGLLAIKNIGSNVTKKIIEIRRDGLFKDFYDFVKRTNKILSKRVIEMLIFSGALDEFNSSRKYMIENYNELVDSLHYNVTGIMNDKIKNNNNNVEEYLIEEIYQQEINSLGIVISSHPIEKITKQLKENNILTPSEIKNTTTNQITICGYVESVKTIKTKENKQMAFVFISDQYENIEVVIFDEGIANNIKVLEKNIILIEGNINRRNNKLQVIASKVKRLHNG